MLHFFLLKMTENVKSLRKYIQKSTLRLYIFTPFKKVGLGIIYTKFYTTHYNAIVMNRHEKLADNPIEYNHLNKK